MNHAFRPRFAPAVLAAASIASFALLSACGGGSDDPTPQATTQAVSIEFAAINGVDASGAAQVVTCASTLAALGTGSVNARLTDLRFYVSNLTLIDSAGQEVKVTLDTNRFQVTRGSDTVALVDLEDDTGLCAGDADLHLAVTGTVPAGSYTGAKFLLGVPTAQNHLDATATTTPAPLTNNDMYWSWTGGYKHVKIELNPENATTTGLYTGGITTPPPAGSATNGSASSWFFHLGDGNCTPGTPLGTSTCGSVNSRAMTLASFNPATQRIAVDLKPLFAQSNLRADTGGAVGCMSGGTDPECQAMWSVLGGSFSRNGAGVIDATSLSVQDTASDFHNARSVFRAIAK